MTRPDGSHSDHTCRYIDENRAEIGYGVDNLYHMAQDVYKRQHRDGAEQQPV